MGAAGFVVGYSGERGVLSAGGRFSRGGPLLEGCRNGAEGWWSQRAAMSISGHCLGQ